MGRTLKIIEKNSQDEELPHKFFLTIRQKTKIRKAFSKNMTTDIKLSNSKLSKIIQSSKFLNKTLGNLSKKALLDLTAPLATDMSPNFVYFRESVLRGGKGFTLFLSNDDMNDIIKIDESLKSSGLLLHLSLLLW